MPLATPKVLTKLTPLVPLPRRPLNVIALGVESRGGVTKRTPPLQFKILEGTSASYLGNFVFFKLLKVLNGILSNYVAET